MRPRACWIVALVFLTTLHADPGNPAIDADAHLVNAFQAMQHRSTHRISQEEFLELSREPGAIVLDARSREKFAMLHIDGAINLPFPDMDVDSLARVLPDTGSRILIYCNNNFSGEPVAFARKLAPASLNLSTFTTLYGYGYRNVYELAPLVDVGKSRLPLAGRRFVGGAR